MHYNGADWSVTPSPSNGYASILYSISARASNDVWAVGAYSSSGGHGIQTFVQHWNGTSWENIQKREDDTSRDNILWSVAAAAPNSVWAVGAHCPRSFGCGGDLTIIEHWNGAQ
jgi:hypothetical protein